MGRFAVVRLTVAEMSTIRHHLRASWLTLALGAGVCVLASCGGGVGGQASNTGTGGGVGSGGTGSYTNGPISGLGSIIVNGVRYDVSKATVKSDDGSAVLPSELNLGMQVEVSSGDVTSGGSGALPTAVASEVRFASALVGPVSAAPDATCDCLTVLGQKVVYTKTTNMPTGLSLHEVVEVFGQPDLANGKQVLVATRVQRVDALSPKYKLVGWVASGASINVVAHTLTVQGPSAPLVVTFTDAQSSQVAALADDDVRRRSVRVWMTGSMSALVLDHLVVDQPLVADRDEARLEGLVTSELNATTGQMSIHGSLVDVSKAPAAARVILAGLHLGDHVRVDGPLVASVLNVSEVYVAGSGSGEIDDNDDGDIELHGAPAGVAAVGDGTHFTMSVHGVNVIYTAAQAPAGLNQGSLSCIEVEGKAYDAQGRLVADVIKTDTSCHE